jgi:beta-mannosidase
MNQYSYPTWTYESRRRLSGDWQVNSTPLDSPDSPEFIPANGWTPVPESAHLQPALFPDRLYWGEHLRPLNHQAWWYRRVFAAPDALPRRARLHFEGVDYFAAVWLNGRLIGQHEGGFAPFTLDATEAIRPGDNTLLVRVTSPWDAPNPRGTYPIDHVLRGLVKGLYEHAEGVIPPDVNPIGIWRPVWLLLDDGFSLDAARVRTALDGTVSVRLTAANAGDETWEGALLLDIQADNHDGPGVQGRYALALPPGVHTLDYSLKIPEARLWWPWDHGQPNLYRLRASLNSAEGLQSERVETFGVRTVRLERSPRRFTYFINERPVFLRGTSYMPGLYLSQFDRETLARDVALARDANLNLLRVHVHVSPPELYDLCDRAGMLVWQDFELNWTHDPSPEFEARALALQRRMIEMLDNHPSVMTWACHNEPTMVFTRRKNLEQHPDPALYADALQQDPTRPVFICSGQMESDWQRAGDLHSYYGAIWSARYTDVYRHHPRLPTEFGFEAPAAPETLRQHPEAWERLRHLEGQIETLWDYQAELTRYHIEHFRRLRAETCAGYIHFSLNDLAPQVGCGVLDVARRPKGGYAALQQASQPVLPALEHDGRRPIALWVFNDTPRAYPNARLIWRVYDAAGRLLLEDERTLDVAANAALRAAEASWPIAPGDSARVELALRDADGTLLAENRYRRPFQPPPRPKGYPWKFDGYLGCKVFDHPTAPSLADHNIAPLFRLVPLAVREAIAERALRQRMPTWLLSAVSRLADRLMP